MTSTGRRISVVIGLLGALASGCGSDDSPSASASGGNGGSGAVSAGGAGGGTGGGAGAGCPASSGSPDATRKVVVSHPYLPDSQPSGDYEVLELDGTGTLTATGTHFEMTRAVYGEVVFTPDGTVGIVPNDTGGLNVFRFDANGAPVVVHAPYTGGFYAKSVVMSPDGGVVYVLDSQWRENGGGIYALDLGSDGTLSGERKVADAKLAYPLRFLSDGRAVVAADDFLASDAGDELFLLNWSEPPSIADGSPAFGDYDAIVETMAVTADERLVMLGDIAEYVPPGSTAGDRVAIVELSGNALSPVQVLADVQDPVELLASPFGGSAIAVSGYGNAIFELAVDPDAAPPVSKVGELSYVGTRPQLPHDAVMVEGGRLTGRVLISENTAVRQVQFECDGSVTDLGGLDLGSGVEVIPGAIGVQP